MNLESKIGEYGHIFMDGYISCNFHATETLFCFLLTMAQDDLQVGRIRTQA